MATVSTTIKLDSELKKEAQKFFDEYGLSLSAAVTMFLRQTVQEWAIPFRIGEPLTLNAMKETLDIETGKIPAKRYQTVDELFAENDTEIAKEG